MTWEEVDDLIDALQEPYSPLYKELQKKVIGQYLKPRDYQTGIRVVEAVTSKPGQYPPTKGDICKVWDDIAQEGTPNAPGQRCAGPLDNAAVQWQKQLTSMSDEEYQRLLHERRRE